MDFYNALCVKKKIYAFLRHREKRGKSATASNKGSMEIFTKIGGVYMGETVAAKPFETYAEEFVGKHLIPGAMIGIETDGQTGV